MQTNCMTQCKCCSCQKPSCSDSTPAGAGDLSLSQLISGLAGNHNVGSTCGCKNSPNLINQNNLNKVLVQLLLQQLQQSQKVDQPSRDGCCECRSHCGDEREGTGGEPTVEFCSSPDPKTLNRRGSVGEHSLPVKSSLLKTNSLSNLPNAAPLNFHAYQKEVEDRCYWCCQVLYCYHDPELNQRVFTHCPIYSDEVLGANCDLDYGRSSKRRSLTDLSPFNADVDVMLPCPYLHAPIDTTYKSSFRHPNIVAKEATKTQSKTCFPWENKSETRLDDKSQIRGGSVSQVDFHTSWNNIFGSPEAQKEDYFYPPEKRYHIPQDDDVSVYATAGNLGMPHSSHSLYRPMITRHRSPRRHYVCRSPRRNRQGIHSRDRPYHHTGPPPMQRLILDRMNPAIAQNESLQTLKPALYAPSSKYEECICQYPDDCILNRNIPCPCNKCGPRSRSLDRDGPRRIDDYSVGPSANHPIFIDPDASRKLRYMRSSPSLFRPPF